MLVVIVPNIKFDSIKSLPQVLQIELQKPEPPAIVPEQPKPVEPPKPEPIKEVVKPKIVPKPITKAIEAPSPLKQEQTPPPPAVDKVIAIAPTIENKAETIAPVPVETPKPKVPEPNQADVDNALNEYGNTLGRAIAKHKQYPRIAQMRGWQGDVMLDLKIDGDGNVLSAKVRDSSGFEALDKQALEMVKKASPFPAPPSALHSHSFNITVPVSFKLENG